MDPVGVFCLDVYVEFLLAFGNLGDRDRQREILYLSLFAYGFA